MNPYEKKMPRLVAELHANLGSSLLPNCLG